MGNGDLPAYDDADEGIRLLEEERRRIARDLHDGPTQSLTNVSLRLELLNRMLETDPDVAKTELSRINHQVVQSITAMRRLLFDLRPIAVDEVGIVAAIKELADKYSREYLLPVQLDAQDDITKDLSPAKQVALYRLVQEILSNIKRHAQASQITITIQRTKSILLSIVDDGQRFYPSKSPAGHHGLIGVQERVAYLKGSLDISSSNEQGSRITISLPIKCPQDDEVTS